MPSVFSRLLASFLNLHQYKFQFQILNEKIMKKLLSISGVIAVLIISCSINSNAQYYHHGNGFYHHHGSYNHHAYYGGGHHNSWNNGYNGYSYYSNNSYGYSRPCTQVVVNYGYQNNYCGGPFRRW